MIRIINGKQYDTSTAMEIAKVDNSLPRNDLSWDEETLFRTAKGNWFLVGKGGSGSKYSDKTEKNTRNSGKQIIPMSAEEVQAWLEKKNCIQALEEYFSEGIEDA